MKELQRRLLMGEEGQRIELLRACCREPEGQEWCRDRFTIFEVLDWMWREEKGDAELLSHWVLDSPLGELYRALVPEGYQPARLAQHLFPTPGRYRLDEKGISGPTPRPLPSQLIPILRRRVRELKPPPGYRFRESAHVIELLPADIGPRISVTQDVLETSGADMVAYGAKDNGEMGGGASGALLVAAGPELESASRAELARSTREIGEVYITPAFGKLLESGTRWVCHIISISKFTDQGAWCPHPERLGGAVEKALALADERKVARLAFSALGTGEGRVTPEHCARLMLEATRKYLREHEESPLQVVFCLPTPRDCEAFERLL